MERRKQRDQLGTYLYPLCDQLGWELLCLMKSVGSEAEKGPQQKANLLQSRRASSAQSTIWRSGVVIRSTTRPSSRFTATGGVQSVSLPSSRLLATAAATNNIIGGVRRFIAREGKRSRPKRSNGCARRCRRESLKFYPCNHSHFAVPASKYAARRITH